MFCKSKLDFFGKMLKYFSNFMNQNENNENAITLQQLNESPDFELSLEPETGSDYNWHKILFNGIEGYVFIDPNSNDYDKVDKWVLLAYGCHNISEAGIAMLKKLEGYRSTAYKPFDDEALWTIGVWSFNY